MQLCVQQHELFVLFWKIIKLMMEFSSLKYLSHLCQRVRSIRLNYSLKLVLLGFLEYSDKIPFVKEAPVEQESKPSTGAKNKK